jgi:hypothetical protein
VAIEGSAFELIDGLAHAAPDEQAPQLVAEALEAGGMPNGTRPCARLARTHIHPGGPRQGLR